MNILSGLSMFAFFAYIYIGIYGFRANRKSKVNKTFLVLCIAMALWSFAYSFAYVAVDSKSFYFWSKIATLGWCSFSAIVLYLVLIIYKVRIAEKILFRIVLFSPVPFFMYISLFFFGAGIEASDFIKSLFNITNFLYNFFYLLIAIIVIIAHGIKSKSNREKRQSFLIGMTSAIPFLLNLITQTILPMAGINIVPGDIGQIYSLIMIFGVYYAITEYSFMNISPSIIIDDILNEMMDLMIIVNINGDVIKANTQALSLLDYKEEELINKSILNLINNAEFKTMVINKNWNYEITRFNNLNCVSKQGDLIPVNISCTNIMDKKVGELVGILIVGQDARLKHRLNKEIEEHSSTYNKLKNSEEIFKLMIDIMPFALVLTRISDSRVIYVNNRALKMFATENRLVLGRLVTDYYSNPEDRFKIINEIKAGTFVSEKEILFKKENGEKFWALLSMASAKYMNEDVLLSGVIDINDNKEFEIKLRKAKEEIELMNKELKNKNELLMEANLILQDKSSRDSLTNLYNHQFMNEILEKEIEYCKKNNESLFVAMIDIDFFKKVNDNFGHQIGDLVIITISKIIADGLGKDHILGRYGGEEFIAILPRIEKQEALNRIEKIRNSIEDYNFNVENLKVTVSIGLGDYNRDNAQNTIKRADTLLYKAKDRGRNRVEWN